MSRIIVKNLPFGTTEQKLKAHIGEGSIITDCSLKYTRDGKFRGFAFVGFKTKEEAQAAIKKYNRSYLNTKRMEIEMCDDLGSERKARAWSRYSKDSSAYQREHAEQSHRPSSNGPKSKTTKKEKKQKKKKEREEKMEELFGELTKDPEFQEFLELHKGNNNKTTWGNDAMQPQSCDPEARNIMSETEKDLSIEEQDGCESNHSEGTSSDQKSSKMIKKNVSDVDYLKSKMRGGAEALLSDDSSDNSESEDDDASSDHAESDESSSDDEQEASRDIHASSSGEEQEESRDSHVSSNGEEQAASRDSNIQHTDDEPQEETKFLVKMKGLPVTVNERQIRDFYKPIVPIAVKIPKNAKGSKAFCVATVEFADESDQTKAMGRNKNFIGSRRIFLHKVTCVEAQKPNKNTRRPWEDKAYVTERDGEEESIAESGRLYLRNLAYCCTQEDLEAAFSKYGPLAEVHLPIDKHTKKIKGFAFVLFMIPEHAVKAYAEMDGKVFQGRMLHILPARSHRDQEMGVEAKSFKDKLEKKRKAEAGSVHNWNTLFLGANAVADVMALKYGTSKSHILDANNGQSLGVRMALGESQIVSETRDFLLENGVLLDSFSQPGGARSKTVLLVKNLPADTKEQELRVKFEQHGTLARLLLPPSGITAIVEFLHPTEAKAAFRNLAYTKFKHLPLYLEWAPSDVFRKPADEKQSTSEDRTESVQNEGEKEEEAEEAESGATLFVKNINFDSTEESLKTIFEKCGKLKSVTISKKKDMKNPGALLSMGYGFVEYVKKASADKALRTLQRVTLDGHALEIKLSNKATNKKAGEEGTLKRRAAGTAGKPSTKILVRNVPFEAKAKEVEELFSVFGELKFCRLPRKMSGTGSHRGFAFVEFLTKNDAKRAFETLCHSTHLYGRRLVLEWASEEDTLDQLRDKTAHYFTNGVPKKKFKKSTLTEALQGGSKTFEV